MPLKEITLGKARELVKSRHVKAEQIAGLEKWPVDSRITLDVRDEPLPVEPFPVEETQGSQEEGSQASAEESPA